MIRKSVQRFSEKIMLKQKDRAGWRFEDKSSRSSIVGRINFSLEDCTPEIMIPSPSRMIAEATGMTEGIKDASALYEVEHRARYGARPGFRITELQISPSQKVPWHYHSNVQDTFYVIE